MRHLIMLLIIACCTLISAYLPNEKRSPNQAIDRWYSEQLAELKMETEKFEILTSQVDAPIKLKGQFLKLRLAYKRLAVLTDYFNLYETAQLNGPALQRTEDDNPSKVIEPHGFQKMEELLWSDTKPNKQELTDEVVYVKSILQQLETEPDRQFKFDDAAILDALRSAVIRLMVLGITGYDSPIAQLSLQETSTTLTAVQELADMLKIDEQTGATQQQLRQQINGALLFINNATNFNSFDRLAFIKEWANPISNSLSALAGNMDLALPAERRPLNLSAKNIFEKDAFDINFFSPNSRYASTPARVLLGKQLFYDKQLSGNGTRSCASCHQPEKAFTDGLPKALALDNKTILQRNTPTLFNAVFQTKQFYDSRQTLLEFQVGAVVHSQQEMGGSIDKTVELLRSQPTYLQAFKNGYPADADPISSLTVSNAIASYMRSLQSLNSRFDHYMRNEPAKFSKEEKNGFNLFMGKAKCGTCHFAPLFNGLVPPRFNETESEVLGVPATGKKKPATLDADSGKYLFTQSIVHLHAFKTPTLRNIALTAPYMHNGVYNTLEEVMDFYNNGGGKGLGIKLANQSLPFDKLDLSKKEKRAIVSFMKTLTDTSGLARSRM